MKTEKLESISEIEKDVRAADLLSLLETEKIHTVNATSRMDKIMRDEGEIVRGWYDDFSLQDQMVGFKWEPVDDDYNFADAILWEYEGERILQLAGRYICSEKEILEDLKSKSDEILEEIASEGGIFIPTGSGFTRGYTGYKRKNLLLASEETLSSAQKEIFDEVKRFVEASKSPKIDSSLNILLHGVPGVGKSYLIRSILTEMDLSSVFVPQGAPGKNNAVEFIYELASKISPAAIVFEDIDLLAGSRDSGFTSLLHSIMEKMDGIFQENSDGVITIATTNKVEEIDEALSDRVGRFQLVRELGKPEEDEIRDAASALPIEEDQVYSRVEEAIEEGLITDFDYLKQVGERLKVYREVYEELKPEHVNLAIETLGPPENRQKGSDAMNNIGY